MRILSSILRKQEFKKKKHGNYYYYYCKYIYNLAKIETATMLRMFKKLVTIIFTFQIPYKK